MPSVSIEKIGPEEAKRLLANNRDNRKLRGTRVESYRLALEKGDFVLTGDAICLAPDGRLLNGQHRLTAIAESCWTVELVVLRDLPEANFHAMDAGMLRTTGDLFRSGGIPYANECSAIARFMHGYLAGLRPGLERKTPRATAIEIERVYLEFREEIDAGAAIGAALWRIYPKSRIGFVAALLHKEHGHEAANFWNLVNPDCERGLDKGHPCRTLRDHYANDPDRRRYEECSTFAYKAISAFNAWAACEPLAKFAPLKSDAPFPSIAKIIANGGGKRGF